MEGLQSTQALNECEGSVDERVEAYNKGVQSIDYVETRNSRVIPISLDLLRKVGGKEREPELKPP